MNNKEDYFKMYLDACKSVETVNATSKNKVGRPKRCSDSEDSILRDKFIKNLGNRVRELRKMKKYTQSKLAKKSHCTTRYIYRVEKLKACPDAYMLLKLSTVLGVPVNALMNLPIQREIDDLRLENKTLREALEITLKIAKES